MRCRHKAASPPGQTGHERTLDQPLRINHTVIVSGPHTLTKATPFAAAPGDPRALAPAPQGTGQYLCHRRVRRRNIRKGFLHHPVELQPGHGRCRIGDGGGYARDLQAVKKTPYLKAVGLGTDTSGLAAQPGPRGSASSSPLIYPFTTEFGMKVYRQRSGHRVFDLNNEGLAHYGLLADLIEDTRQQQGGEVYEALMNSAEGYLQMWERAEANNTSGHVNPL